MGKQDQPIVSVAVIAYNSSKTIVETLDSIYNQTYTNIELIISDDCSTDNTLQVCNIWLNKHQERFTNFRVIVPPKNTGVAGNCQRAWDACKTRWFKFIAGDDLLLPNCIEDNVNYVSIHSEAMCVFSRTNIVGLVPDEAKLFMEKRFDYSFFDLPQEERYEKIMWWCCIPTASAFLNHEELKKKDVNFDLRMPMMEDRIFFLRALEAGVYFDFMDKETVSYRVRRDSLCNAILLSPRFYESVLLANFNYPFAHLYKTDPDSAIREMVKREMTIYEDYYLLKKESMTFGYKLYMYLTHPSRIFWRAIHIFHKK